MTEPPPSDRAAARRSQTRRRLLRTGQLVVTGAAFFYLYSTLDLATVGRAATRIPLLIFATGFVLVFAANMIGALRWRLLFTAFGAPHPPPVGDIVRFYLVGLFYNTYLPGGVLGEVVRGVASRQAFGTQGGATGGLAVVFVERVLGLAGMLLLVATMTTIHPLKGIPWLVPFGVAGVVGAAAVLVGLLLARRIAALVPKPIGSILSGLPVPRHYGLIMVALVLSVTTHGLGALSGHLLVEAIHPGTDFLDSLAIIPLALSATYLPITLSGAGVREAIYGELYGFVGVPEEAAVAGALGAWACQLAVAAVGGVLALLQPVAKPDQAGTKPAL